MRKSPGRELWWSKEFSDHIRVRRYDGEPVGTKSIEHHAASIHYCKRLW